MYQFNLNENLWYTGYIIQTSMYRQVSFAVNLNSYKYQLDEIFPFFGHVSHFNHLLPSNLERDDLLRDDLLFIKEPTTAQVNDDHLEVKCWVNT